MAKRKTGMRIFDERTMHESGVMLSRVHPATQPSVALQGALAAIDALASELTDLDDEDSNIIHAVRKAFLTKIDERTKNL